MPPSTDGRWTGLSITPGDSRTTGDAAGVFVIHALLLKNGNVLWWSGHAETVHYLAESYEWNPSTAISTAIKSPFPSGVDVFCCHHALLDDGRVLTVGGASHHHGTGIKNICIYDPATHTWSHIGDMNQARWYPTLVQLPDGSFAVFSGRTEDASVIAETVEILKPPFVGPGYTTQTLSGGDKTLPTYPALHMLAGGKIVFAGPNWRYESGASSPFTTTYSFVRTGDTTGIWIDEGVRADVINREEGMSILLPPAQDARVLVVGGGWPESQNPGTDHRSGSDLHAAEILSQITGALEWMRIGNLTLPRVNPNVVLLPDGRVLVHGGHDSYKWSSGQVPSNQAELYDPVLDTWTAVASMSERRQYHSASLLLPDGRVITAGGVDPSRPEPVSGGTLNQKTLEFYEPPYFFNGIRPVITSVTRTDGPVDEIPYGGQFQIETPQAPSIRKVVLMKPASMTHHTDSQQRYIPLTFFQSGATTLTVGVVNDPSVAPPGIYMLWILDENNLPCQQAPFINVTRKSCYIVTDRSHFSNDEVNTSSPTTFADSFYVIMDGFLPAELGVSLPIGSLTGIAPVITFERAGVGVPEITAAPDELLLEDSSLPEGLRQRFTFKYQVTFANNNPFLSGGTPIELQTVTIRAVKNSYVCFGEISLTNQPNPYMLDGPTYWLSTDVRVFQISQSDDLFGRNVGSDENSAIAFIQNLLTDFNADTATGLANFGMLDPDQDRSKLELSRSKDGQRIFNFAIAKVSYQGRSLSAQDVRVFFRMFNTMTTGMEYHGGTTYRTILNPHNEPIPLLGINGGEILSIPFFAEARVNTAMSSMSTQRDLNNVRTITPVSSGERHAFFGCWLDINQTALRFPLTPGGFGPFTSGMQSIQRLLRGKHQCLVAEVHFTGDPILENHTPANNDNLSQRNLAIIESDNPGSTATHTVQHTFELKSSLAIGVGSPFKIHEYFFDDRFIPDHGHPNRIERRLVRIVNDELLIEWNNVPRDSKASIYFPDIKADQIIQLSNLKLGTYKLSKLDEHTIGCVVGDVTYIPLPAAGRANVVALLSIELPPTITKGGIMSVNGKEQRRKADRFNVTMRQLDGMRKQIHGSFDLVIPVSSKELLLADEVRYLSVLKHIAEAIPPTDRWFPIFHRYLLHVGDRVRGFGADPDKVPASPDGYKFPEPSFWSCCGLKRVITILLAIICVLAGIILLRYTEAAWIKILGALIVLLGIVLGIKSSRKCDCHGSEKH